MTRDMTELQIKKLEEEHEQALLDLERLLETLKSEVDPDADEGDPDVAEREKVFALVTGLERKLKSIEDALRQARAGKYGTCEGCEKQIDPARLEIVPEATLCVACKTLAERGVEVRAMAA
jgi:DnaK suppressor protein